MKKFYNIIILFFACLTTFGGDKIVEKKLDTLGAAKSQWNGFDKYDFQLSGTKAVVAIPAKPRKDRAWIFRPAYFGAFI